MEILNLKNIWQKHTWGLGHYEKFKPENNKNKGRVNNPVQRPKHIFNIIIEDKSVEEDEYKNARSL